MIDNDVSSSNTSYSSNVNYVAFDLQSLLKFQNLEIDQKFKRHIHMKIFLGTFCAIQTNTKSTKARKQSRLFLTEYSILLRVIILIAMN